MENHLPTFFVCVQSDNVADLIETATLNGNPSNLRQISNAVQAANEVWISAANNHAGKVASIFGDEVSIEFPIKELDSVEDWQRQHTEASDITCCVGVGHTLNEAKRALMAAQLIAPGTIKCYTSLVEQILASTAGLAKSESTDLSKNKVSPTFPKLGVPDNRRETDIVNTRRQVEMKQRSMWTKDRAQRGIKAEWLPKLGEEGYKGAVDAEYEKQHKQHARAGGLSSMGQSYAKGLKVQTRAKGVIASTPGAIQIHEDFHNLMGRVTPGEGERKQLVLNLVNHSYNALPPEARRLAHSILSGFGGENNEEHLAQALSYLNDPKFRGALENKLPPAVALAAHKAVRDFYGHFRHAAQHADESWKTSTPNPIPPRTVTKSEESDFLDLMFKSESTDLRLDFRNLVDELDTITTVHDEALNVQTEEHQELDDLKAEVRGVLDEIHGSLPQLELLEQTSPAAYHVIVALLRSVEDLAEKLFGDEDTEEDRMPGGLADDVPDEQFDPSQLAQGTKVESEHTDDPVVAKQISKDHLSEDAAYYTKLAEMEKASLDPGKTGRSHLMLPVGSTVKGKIKVKLPNGKTSWRSVRSGLAMDSQGQPVSVRKVD